LCDPVAAARGSFGTFGGLVAYEEFVRYDDLARVVAPEVAFDE
jgi:hypothetical protein